MSDLPTPSRSREILVHARELIERGLGSEARDLLDGLARAAQMEEDPALGPMTVLGYPRKLHSAYLKLAKLERDAVQRIGLQHSLVPPPALLSPFTQFGSDERRRMNAVNGRPVPRMLHQIWLGTLPVPPAVDAWRAHAATHGLHYRLWREADLEALGVAQHASFQQMMDQGDYPGAVDIARYFILHAEGGIYLDCDWYPARDDLSFADIMPLIGLSALAEDTPRDTGVGSLLLTNSFIAAPPGHPVFERLLAVLPDVTHLLPDGPAWWSTGPLIMTLLFRATTFSVPDATFVAATLKRRAPYAQVEAARAKAAQEDGGLLIGWKPW
jgi:inositol phosphorylceramide mannosyltransferase catalytic subunit